jgi:ACR3 family arsenite efflux pump ArsB
MSIMSPISKFKTLISRHYLRYLIGILITIAGIRSVHNVSYLLVQNIDIPTLSQVFNCMMYPEYINVIFTTMKNNRKGVAML